MKTLTRSSRAFSAAAACPANRYRTARRGLPQRFGDRHARRAVAVAKNFGPFQQLALFHHRIEAGGIDEMIIAAVDFAAALRPRGDRDREFDLRSALQQHPRQRGLARAGRRRQHEHQAAARNFASISFRAARAMAYSTFCTCSRNCSTAALSSKPILVSSTSFALAHSVLASRLSSCARKSRRRPIAPPCSIGVALARHAPPADRAPRAHRPWSRSGSPPDAAGRDRSARTAPAASRSARQAARGSLRAGGRATDRRAAASAAISPSRVASTRPSAAPSCRRISASAPIAVGETCGRRRLGAAPLVLVLLGVADLDHALERKQAVERRRRRFDSARQLPHRRQDRIQHRSIDPDRPARRRSARRSARPEPNPAPAFRPRGRAPATSSASQPGGRRSRRSRPLPLTDLISQAQA